VDIGTAVTGQEESSARAGGDVLDVHMMPAVLAEALQQAEGFPGGSQWLDQFHLATREVVVLNVNDQ
jgi:hypothetical protein